MPANAYFLDYFKAQHAGELGQLAVGVGKRIGKRYSLDYLNGFVRSEDEGASLVTVALKNNLDFYTHDFGAAYASFYGGLAVYHVTGLRYHASRRVSFPDSYYSIGSIRGLLYLGLKGGRFGSRHQGYFEAGLNDIWQVNAVVNRDTIDPTDYVSLALGYAFLF